MTELERYKKALDEVMGRMNTCCRATDFDAAQRAVVAILNPPQEFEEVEEIVGWVNIYPVSWSCRVYQYRTKEDADQNASVDRIACQEIKVKVTRPIPQKVERSVSIPAEILNGQQGYRAGTTLGEFTDFPECHGKRGLLTFTWTE